jgi:hypothetical protein
MTAARTLAVIATTFALSMFGTFTDRPGITLAGIVAIVGAVGFAWTRRDEVTR